VAKKQIKVGVKQFAGRPPGFLWHEWNLDLAFKEAMEFLDDGQYRHMALQMQDLATEDDPTHSSLCSVRQIEDFYELRDWGGVLRSLNVRVFFGVDKARHALVVIGAIQKQNNGPTPLGDKVRMRRRWRKYLDGDYGYP
jgi:hypothetical protein